MVSSSIVDKRADPVSGAEPLERVIGSTAALILALLLTPLCVFAQPTGLIINGQGTATLTWTRPTTNADGTPLAAADITGYGLFFGPQSRFSSGTTLRAQCAATPTSLSSTTCYSGATPIGGSAVSAPVTITLAQSSTIYFALATQKTGGQISTYSSEVAKIFTLTVSSAPGAPTLQSVNVTMNCTTNDPQITCTFTVQ